MHIVIIRQFFFTFYQITDRKKCIYADAQICGYQNLKMTKTDHMPNTDLTITLALTLTLTSRQTLSYCVPIIFTETSLKHGRRYKPAFLI